MVSNYLRNDVKTGSSGPLNRLNAILSLLHPLDPYGTPAAIESAIEIGRAYLALSRIYTQVGVLNRLVLNHLGSQPRNCGATVSKAIVKQAAKQNVIEVAILNCVLDCD